MAYCMFGSIPATLEGGAQARFLNRLAANQAYKQV